MDLDVRAMHRPQTARCVQFQPEAQWQRATGGRKQSAASRWLRAGKCAARCDCDLANFARRLCGRAARAEGMERVGREGRARHGPRRPESEGGQRSRRRDDGVRPWRLAEARESTTSSPAAHRQPALRGTGRRGRHRTGGGRPRSCSCSCSRGVPARCLSRSFLAATRRQAGGGGLGGATRRARWTVASGRTSRGQARWGLWRAGLIGRKEGSCGARDWPQRPAAPAGARRRRRIRKGARPLSRPATPNRFLPPFIPINHLHSPRTFTSCVLPRPAYHLSLSQPQHSCLCTTEPSTNRQLRLLSAAVFVSGARPTPAAPACVPGLCLPECVCVCVRATFCARPRPSRQISSALTTCTCTPPKRDRHPLRSAPR